MLVGERCRVGSQGPSQGEKKFGNGPPMAAFPANAAAAGVAPAGTTEGARPAADCTPGRATTCTTSRPTSRAPPARPHPRGKDAARAAARNAQTAFWGRSGSNPKAYKPAGWRGCSPRTPEPRKTPGSPFRALTTRCFSTSPLEAASKPHSRARAHAPTRQVSAKSRTFARLRQIDIARV